VITKVYFLSVLKHWFGNQHRLGYRGAMHAYGHAN